MTLRSERTRASLLDAALAAFAQRGIRSTTLEDVAMAARVTRGAVYWHFADKAAVVREVFNGLVWPFDIGTDIDVYKQSGAPMQLLRDVLWLRMKNSLDDAAQQRMIQLLLKSSGAEELPDDLSSRLEEMATRSIKNLTAVLNICYLRRVLRRGLTPLDVAMGIHATGLGVLAENTNQLPHSLARPFFLPLELVLLGACKESRKNSSLLILDGRGSLK